MKQNVKEKISWSAQQLRDRIWPILQMSPMIDVGRLVRVEEHDKLYGTHFTDLDREDGIDYFIRYEQGGSKGFASRVTKDTFSEFTIRVQKESGCDTEFQKRCRSIDQGLTRPVLATHGHVDPVSNRLLSVGVVGSDDLITFLRQNFDRITKKWTNIRDARFAKIPYTLLKECGIKVWIWDCNTGIYYTPVDNPQYKEKI